jgi:hypothetical protein
MRVITTTTRSLENRKSGIPWEELCITFQDAITFTRELGCKYLWIDSFCIIQDDRADWERESAKMASIYRRSSLTIAASRSVDGNGGLFPSLIDVEYVWCHEAEPESYTEPPIGNRTVLRVKHPALWIPYPSALSPAYWMSLEPSHATLKHQRRRPASVTWDMGLPLFTRAWFLQERLLSPRVIHFGHMELYWECEKGMRCQCLESDGERREFISLDRHSNVKELYSALRSEPSIHKDAPDRTKYRDAWQMLVEEYSWLSITYETDRLPALSGVADDESRVYLAGVWLDDFPECLYWNTAASPPTLARRPFSYRAPSFSWASIEGPVNYCEIPTHRLVPGTRRTVAKVREHDSIPEGHDPRGRVAAGHISIEGWCGTATVAQLHQRYTHTLCELHKDGMKQTFPLDISLMLCKSEPAEITSGDELTCLLLECEKPDPLLGGSYLYQLAALALRTSRTEGGSYERVGLIISQDHQSCVETDDFEQCGMFQAAPSWFNGSERRILKIL